MSAQTGYAQKVSSTLAWKRLSLRTIKLLLLALVLYYVGAAVAQQINALSWSEVYFRPTYALLALASALAGRMLLVPAYGLMLLPDAPSLRWHHIAPAVWLPALGRYIPGKVLTIAWATSLLRQRGVSGPVAMTIPFLLTSLALMVGLTLATPLMIWHPVSDHLPLAWGWGMLCFVGSLVCCHPRVITGVGNYTLRRLRRRGRIVLPSLRRYLLVVILIAGQFVPAGVALWLLARALTEVSILWLPILVSGVALSASMSLLAIFAPGGIGVREGIMLVILTPVVGEGLAAVLVIAQRCLHIVAELVLAAVGFMLLNGLWPLHRLEQRRCSAVPKNRTKQTEAKHQGVIRL